MLPGFDAHVENGCTQHVREHSHTRGSGGTRSTQPRSSLRGLLYKYPTGCCVKSMLQAQVQVRNHPARFCLFSWFDFVVLLNPKLTLTVNTLYNTWDLALPPFLIASAFITIFSITKLLPQMQNMPNKHNTMSSDIKSSCAYTKASTGDRYPYLIPRLP